MICLAIQNPSEDVKRLQRLRVVGAEKSSLALMSIFEQGLCFPHGDCTQRAKDLIGETEVWSFSESFKQRFVELDQEDVPEGGH